VPSPFLRWNLLLTDIGFLLYWGASAFDLFPPDWLYKDHHSPVLMAWNWSFAPVAPRSVVRSQFSCRLTPVASGLGGKR
jgi:hypothetical protein